MSESGAPIQKMIKPCSFVACQRQWLVDLPIQKRDVSRAVIIHLARAHRQGDSLKLRLRKGEPKGLK